MSALFLAGTAGRGQSGESYPRGVIVTEWDYQDARNRFSALVDAALRGEPQRVNRRGRPAVVVLAVEEYERLRLLDGTAAPTLARLLLEVPQDDGEFERLPFPPRPLEEA